MADQHSNHKRQRKGDDEMEQMHKKRERNDNKAAIKTKEEPVSITNIYYDCLEHIFDFLDLENLLNVAGTCKRLQIAAAAKFGDDHGKENIFICRSSWIFKSKIDTNRYSINVSGLKFCFPFLRCFGAKLSNLCVYYGADEDVRNEHLDRYINQYCADALTGVEMTGKRPFVIENFPKPFKNVATVGIYDLNLGNKLPNLVNLFPNLRELKMRFVTIDETAATGVCFPHLEKLSFQICVKSDFTTGMAVNLLHANRQLKSLEIHAGTTRMAFANLLKMINGLQSISALKLDGYSVDCGADELNRFVSEHSLIEVLRLPTCRFTADGAKMLIRQLGSLKEFVFQVKDQTECNRFLNQLDNKWKHNTMTFPNNITIMLWR